jgi:CHASE2 domain-containing sensor protein
VALAAGLSVLWGIFTLLAQFSGAMDAFEQPLVDWRQTLHAMPAHSSDQLALIAIDRIPPDHPWPWSRLDFSLLLRSLIDYAPQSVVFEMNLTDRDTVYTSFDDTFSHIVQRANGVVFAATMMTRKDASPMPANVVSIPIHGDVDLIPQFENAAWPLDTFAGTSPVGANNVEGEADMHIRKLPLIFIVGNKVVPSLVLQATAQFLGASLEKSEIQVGRAIFLRRRDGTLLRAIPIDNQGRMDIRFHPGPVASWQATYDNALVYDDQIQHNIKPGGNMRELEHRQVWVGRTDDAQRERFITPVGTLSRVEVELQAERTILDQDYVRPLPPLILAMIYLLIGVAGSAALVRLGPLHAAVMLIIAASFWFESSVLAFRLYNVILPLPSFLMLIFGTFVVGYLASIWEFEPETETK